jgi:phosphoribosylanthranilate isomerase
MGKRPKAKVKICGITNWPDARRAVEAGADFLGFNFYAGSPRYIEPEKARRIVRRLPKRVGAVGVFVNESEEKMAEIARSVGLAQLQLHGDESPAVVRRLSRSFSVIKAVRVRKSFRATQLNRFKDAKALLLDSFDAKQRGGTGKAFNWSAASHVNGGMKIFLAGGITPENVEAAIRITKPYAVDVCSGVEAKPGKKDAKRLKDLMRAVEKARREA